VEDNIKVTLQDTGRECVDWIHLALDWVQQHVLVYM